MVELKPLQPAVFRHAQWVRQTRRLQAFVRCMQSATVPIANMRIRSGPPFCGPKVFMEVLGQSWLSLLTQDIRCT